MKYDLLTGDVVEILPTLPANSFDAALCDPPYSLSFMGRDWDRNVEHREWSVALLRVLKPGAMLLAFGGTRTHHRLMCALEDAGFEIRDTLCWLYGSGFPKSLDISKAIDKAAGIWRGRAGAITIASQPSKGTEYERTPKGKPATATATAWSGYGTALKPAWEPCVVAMKPLDGTFAHNAQKWGVAGINVDGGRVGVEEISTHGSGDKYARIKGGESNGTGEYRSHLGRWPANVLLDESAARQLDQMSGDEMHSAGHARSGMRDTSGEGRGMFALHGAGGHRLGDSGGASRFFYTAKVSTAEREGSDHPTMKPIDLTRYLAKLILPPPRETPRRIVVPFAGVGSEMIGAILAGWDEVVGIEKDEKYAAKARERITGTAPLFLQEATNLERQRG